MRVIETLAMMAQLGAGPWVVGCSVGQLVGSSLVDMVMALTYEIVIVARMMTNLGHDGSAGRWPLGSSLTTLGLEEGRPGPASDLGGNTHYFQPTHTLLAKGNTRNKLFTKYRNTVENISSYSHELLLTLKHPFTFPLTLSLSPRKQHPIFSSSTIPFPLFSNTFFPLSLK